MEQQQILKNNSLFAGYEVVSKLSAHHDGEREVYLAKKSGKDSMDMDSMGKDSTDMDSMSMDSVGKDSMGKEVVLVVFNLRCERYLCKNVGRKHTPDFIEEVRIYSELKNECFPKIVDQGIDKVGNKRFAWVALEYINGVCLDKTMDLFSFSDTIMIAKKLSLALRELGRLTGGGGHYNIRPENIIVDYDNNTLKGVHIVGMALAGKCFNGNPPFNYNHLSNLYRAPETSKGIFDHTSDVYSMGMLMLMMLLGYKVPEHYGYGCIMPSAEVMNDEDIKNHKWQEPTEWNRIVLDCANENLPTSARLVLQKATAVNSFTRILTFDKLLSYLALLEKRSVKTTTVVEPSEITGNMATLKKDIREAIRPARNSEMTGISQSSSGKGLDEVAGMSDLKSVLRRNFVDIVKNSQMAKLYDIAPPNGILLYGAPGCGKTFVAEKTAQESGLKYKIINPSDFASIYIHGSQSKIAETFKEAEKNAPIILIFDEFDAIAPRRDTDSNHQANEVNEILAQLNNCASKGVFVLATTNRPDMIDAACLRAGRMDEKFYVGLPDADARKEIFAMELKKRPCDSAIDLDQLCNATADYTCGDISYIVKETARRCFDEVLRNGDGNAVPLTTEKLMEVAKSTIPSVSPKDLRLYQDLKEKMEHKDRENKSRGRVGFLTGA